MKDKLGYSSITVVILTTVKVKKTKNFREDMTMISTLIAGLSILLFSGMANTYFSQRLFSDTEFPPEDNNL
ncbi:hypothetical protein SAMD00079811_18670 [Scytonema sp. HK-05]|nr:hypothetical protein NIES2130_32965 [Scytonema sp. HK-05]BAY44271.1 hypothetical protein SAMD00079811_18670 [Scytonema sp. HK-05]